jgi:hypothetical protein
MRFDSLKATAAGGGIGRAGFDWMTLAGALSVSDYVSICIM